MLLECSEFGKVSSFVSNFSSMSSRTMDFLRFFSGFTDNDSACTFLALRVKSPFVSSSDCVAAFSGLFLVDLLFFGFFFFLSVSSGATDFLLVVSGATKFSFNCFIISSTSSSEFSESSFLPLVATFFFLLFFFFLFSASPVAVVTDVDRHISGLAGIVKPFSSSSRSDISSRSSTLFLLSFCLFIFFFFLLVVSPSLDSGFVVLFFSEPFAFPSSMTSDDAILVAERTTSPSSVSVDPLRPPSCVTNLLSFPELFILFLSTLTDFLRPWLARTVNRSFFSSVFSETLTSSSAEILDFLRALALVDIFSLILEVDISP